MFTFLCWCACLSLVNIGAFICTIHLNCNSTYLVCNMPAWSVCFFKVHLSSLWLAICVLQGIPPRVQFHVFCYWTRPFDIFNFTVPPIWQVHCTSRLICTLRFKTSLHFQERWFILSFILAFICLQQTFFSFFFTWASNFAGKNHYQTYSMWLLDRSVVISIC